uniref:Uncharacterized protein n=1 Tax=Timema poppense TaxID=170557 RepID=A0A7R9DTT5_TIMPO|nr:unnamed protein product [Timema poppensis]
MAGNEIHEWLLRHGKLRHVNMTVPEAITAAGSSMRFICEWKSLVYLLALEESLYEQMTETLAEWHQNPPPRRGSDLYVVLIADNRSVLFIFQKDMEKVTLVDSHQHLNHGAMVAQVPGARLEQLCVWYNNVLRNYYGSRPECFELSFLYFKRYEAGEMAAG